MKNKLLSTLLLIAVLLLAACTGVQTPAGEPAQDQEETQPESTESVSIRFTSRMENQTDLEEVEEAINEVLRAEIGAEIKIEALGGAAYDEKTSLRFAAGETCDIIWVAPWMPTSYAQHVSNGSLLPLDDLLKEQAPELWASMPEETWNAARIDGNIYGVINQQGFPKTWGVFVQQAAAEKYGLDVDAMERYEDLEPLLQAVVDEEGLIPFEFGQTWRLHLHEYFGWDPVAGENLPLGIKADDENMTVIFGPEDAEYASLLETIYRWSQNGYTALELPSRPDAASETSAGLHVAGNHIMWPGNDINYSAKYGQPFLTKSLTDPILTTGGTTATLTGICATSEHPEEAMQVLNMINTDAGGVFTMLTRGIEGKHWEWVDQDQNLIQYLSDDPKNSGYFPNSDWSLGNTFLAPLTDPDKVGINEMIYEMNQAAMPSVALGFSFNPEPVETELASVAAVEAEFGVPLREGQLDPATSLPTYIEKLKDAGIDVVIAELQQQLNDWAASQ